eukprot:TRINITY_DN4688_c0_g1_i1.p1 TRINITY_DN4688_c0_g1~~TRINITY_DN4688_c0_g1_i1.p1  ORF type:complete len:333 (-),score=109.19 TRINITY_DN4688_c0_g1_i1:7-1005(-)
MSSTLEEDEIVIRLKAVGLSGGDHEGYWAGGHRDLERLKVNQRSNFIGGYEISGTVEEIGTEAKMNCKFNIGDEVFALCPLDYATGFSKFTNQKYWNVFAKPSNLSHEDASATIGPCIRAYLALHYKMRMMAGETILILEAASPDGFMALQLASKWGGKVFVTSCSEHGISFLEDQTHLNLARVIDTTKENILEVIMSETGGIGVDFILDTRHASEGEKPSLFELFKCLGVNGHIVLHRNNLTLDPPDSQLLRFKSCSVSFLFEQAWILSNSQQGRYLHMMQDIYNKLSSGELKPSRLLSVLPLEEKREALQLFEAMHKDQSLNLGKIVITP